MKYMFGYSYGTGGGKRVYTANNAKEAYRMAKRDIAATMKAYRPGGRYEIWFERYSTIRLNQGWTL